MNLQLKIDFILEKVLGSGYTIIHVIFLMVSIVLIVMILKRGKKK